MIFKQKRALAARWSELNYVLMDGEIGVESDTRSFKIGDGETPWNTLPYYTGKLGSVLSLPKSTQDPEGSAGDMYFNTSYNVIRWHNGTAWSNL